jgi:hypothetical protein
MLALGLFLLPATHALYCGVDTGKSVGIGLQRLLDTLAATTLWEISVDTNSLQFSGFCRTMGYAILDGLSVDSFDLSGSKEC